MPSTRRLRVSPGSWSAGPCSPCSGPYRLFESLQIGQQIVNLIWIELESGHVVVAGVDAFSQGLTERLDRVALVQGSERRSDLEWAFGYPVDGVAARAIGSGEGLAPL